MNEDSMIKFLKEIFDDVDKTVMILSNIDDESSKQMIKDEVFLHLDCISSEFDKYLSKSIESDKFLVAPNIATENDKEIKLIQLNDCIMFINHHLEIPVLGSKGTEIILNEKLLDSFLSSGTPVILNDFGQNSLDYRLGEIYKNIRELFNAIDVTLKKLYDEVFDKETAVNEEFGMYVRQYLIFAIQEYYAFYISIKGLCEKIKTSINKTN